jgi:menaquinone-dependent protoporphyrinogen oxidase
MTDAKISRRDFLKTAAITLGAATTACSGFALLGRRQSPVTFPNETIGEKMTARRVLVAYASRGGSTGGVAEAIGKTLAETGFEVHVGRMTAGTDLGPYDAVVLGSAIRGKAWLPEAMEFVRAHQDALRTKPVAAFLVCITLAMPIAAHYKESVRDFMKDVRPLITPRTEAYFAGALDYSKVPLVPEGLQLRVLSAASKTPPGDYRDWDAIRAWAAQLPGVLGAA